MQMSLAFFGFAGMHEVLIVGMIILTSVSIMWCLSGMGGIFAALTISALGFGAVG